MQQALDYAETLKIPFVFSSNGDGFVFHDRTGASTPRESNFVSTPSRHPPTYGRAFAPGKGSTANPRQIVLQDYHDDGSGKEPRYYQVNAVNAAIEAIAKGQDRVLLVMATGTGKTYTAFQIIWRLWKSRRWNPEGNKRVLFLADRNVLIDQTMVNDFRPFGAAMAKLSTNAKTIERQDGTSVDLTLALDRKRRIDTAFEVYLGLYQAITGPEERQKLFKEFSEDFFDLIVIDECHRGSAAEDSAWREILEPLLRRDANRPDRNAEGDGVRLQHGILWRAGVHLFAEAGHQRRLSGALQGHQGSHRPGRGRLSAGERASWTATATRSRTASTMPRILTARWCWTTAPF
jgi:type I restriction enzyme R subunit